MTVHSKSASYSQFSALFKKEDTSDFDTGIEKNWDAALIPNGLHRNVKYDVKNGVVTLTGEVDSRSVRAQAEQISTSVPKVRQVLNKLQSQSQKASSSN
jgi:osmotically-inducible protein OsmY